MENTRKVLLTLMSVLTITAGALGVASCGSGNGGSSIGSSASSSEGLKYTLNENDNSYTLSDIGTCTDTDIVIPSVYNGYPITSIGYGAFANCDSLTSIVIPDGVTSINERAFYDCSSLTSIEIPDGVTSIGEAAFYNCSSLTSVTIGNGVTSIGSYAFYDCSSLTSIEIPDGVTSIGDWAFVDCSSLTSVTFKNTSGWTADDVSLSNSDLENPSTAAEYLALTYYEYSWKRS